ncbi:helix-turn-helix domain-containing protein [Oceanimonas doudoroffii]|uniref:AraC family transcriptional regulator n=1 Tax=Oceanimonas doudoroffii TaxID=84158 RepID=A0A233RJA4_9GAMM|nr:AraC family transcriptional regulator [Oceanimonas doudoroffii]OXY83469.1 AraC family transcriptional regulator [Oceanimonas doudoroffii]
MSSFKPCEILTLPAEMTTHQHHYNQMVIGLNGQTEFDIGGSGCLLGPGQGCLVASEQDHAFGGLGRNSILVVNLPPLVTSWLPDGDERLSGLFDQPRYFQLPPQARQLVSALSQEISSQPEDELLGQACAHTLMCALQRHMAFAQARPRRPQLNMDLIDDYIRLHLHRKITVTQLAGCVFLGESQFHQLFKEQTGLSPYQYVLKQRLAEACRLLVFSQHSLADIAQRCGFSSQSLFTQVFSRHHNVSPARYRKLHA